MAFAPPPRSSAIQIVRPPTSSAIQIVRPPPPAATSSTSVGSQSGAVASKVSASTEGSEKGKKGDATQRLCRNVLIYGSCKFQDQGCAYFHPSPDTEPMANNPSVAAPATPAAPNTPITRSTLNAAAQVYPTPESKDARISFAPPGISAEHLAAPVFVPKTPLAETSPRPSSPLIMSQQPPPEWTPISYGNRAEVAGLAPPMAYEDASMNYESTATVNTVNTINGNVFMPHSETRRKLDYHLYTAPLPHIVNPPINHQPMHSFFIPDDLRRMVQARQEATYAYPGITPGVPAEVHVYHSLVKLEDAPTANPVSKVYGLPAPVYRATSTIDGNVYCLRRLEGFKLLHESAFTSVETWRKMRHPNIVGLREAFTSKAFGDNFMVYDFFPDSTTLWDEHLNPETAQRRPQVGVSERVIWSYVVQLANALKAIHTSGLAARNLDPSKILLTGKNRIRINGCGMVDVMAYDMNTPIAMYQQEDLVSFGKLIITLCCDFFQPGQHPGLSLEHISRNYSQDIKNLILFLISKPSPMKTIDEVIKLAGPRILNELDAAQSYNDLLESELGSEIENGRIVRLLTKLGFINERPEFDMDPRWSETGDRYVLKLFRDYVFHSTGADGKPVIDLSHVLTILNKLDAGARSREKVMLVSRDGQSCLVVEYRDIFKCIEATYNELRNAGVQLGGMPRR